MTSLELGTGTDQDTDSSGAPIMVIRDLATDTAVRTAPETKSLGNILDDLISPDLALALITMCVKGLVTDRNARTDMLTYIQFPRALWPMGSFRPGE